MRSTGRGPSTPSEAGAGVVSSDPGLPQPALTEAAFSELTLSFWVKSLRAAVGSRRSAARSGTGLRFDRQH